MNFDSTCIIAHNDQRQPLSFSLVTFPGCRWGDFPGDPISLACDTTTMYFNHWEYCPWDCFCCLCCPCHLCRLCRFCRQCRLCRQCCPCRQCQNIASSYPDSKAAGVALAAGAAGAALAALVAQPAGAAQVEQAALAAKTVPWICMITECIFMFFFLAGEWS